MTNLKELISLLIEVVELVEDVDVVDHADDALVPKLKQQNNFLVLCN